jgi:methionine-rich copper-binding protein CopC
MKKLMLMAALTLPLAAFAHAHLESSVPGKGSTVQASPGKVELVFNEPVALTALKLQKKGDATARDLAPLPREESVYLAVPLARLADGEYVLTYAGVSSDQHETKGTIEFKVSATSKPSTGSTAGKKEGMEHMHGGSGAGHDHNHADAPK